MKKTVDKHQSYGTIAGIKIDSTSRIKLLSWIKKKIQNLDKDSLGWPRIRIVTPNPEQILMAQNDKELARILNSAHVSIPDGIGIAVADKYLRLKAPSEKFLRFPVSLAQGIGVGSAILFRKKWLQSDITIIKGREFFIDLIRMAHDHKWRVFLVGSKNGVAEQAAKNLHKVFKRVSFRAMDGPDLNNQGLPVNVPSEDLEKQIIININEFRPHLLFIAFQNPKQEKWLDRWIGELKVGAAMVVGGTLDYAAGTSKLPPRHFSHGFEWLWRLVTQPGKRLKRVWNATVLFPLHIFKHKLRTVD
jgi:N-acetylglucosaminyldiphosphoundecaprenol N-acetyl-beta-D-mannosaminyltransferase